MKEEKIKYDKPALSFENHKLDNMRCGSIIFICRHFLSFISPTSQWHIRVENLFDEYPEIPVKEMGLPQDWRNHPIWKPQHS